MSSGNGEICEMCFYSCITGSKDKVDVALHFRHLVEVFELWYRVDKVDHIPLLLLLPIGLARLSPISSLVLASPSLTQWLLWQEHQMLVEHQNSNLIMTVLMCGPNTIWVDFLPSNRRILSVRNFPTQPIPRPLFWRLRKSNQTT